MSKCTGFRCASAILLLAVGLDASAVESIVYGPVNEIAPDGSAVSVLGQRFQVTDATLVSGFAIDGKATGAFHLANTSADRPLLVVGERLADGSLRATEVRAVDVRYVAGSTEVVVAGRIEAAQAGLASITIGGSQIYIGDIAALPRGIAPGVEVTVIGTQALPQAPIWASSIVLGNTDATRAKLESITGTGVRLQSITGTGKKKQSITGTGVSLQSITGTGKKTQSITGTGAQLQSITGTGVQLQSITGTGKKTQSITGTGAQLQSITGTGVQLQSITGTGKKTQSITGTGVQLQSITGTGVQLQSITGTGVQLQSITGTGVQLQSITGTGVQLQSITGTGVRSQSITGTGVRMHSITGTGVRE